MTESAHIFNPRDDSLSERIRAYREAYKAWMNSEASLRLLDDDKWSDRLGDREAVEEAHKISVHSLEMASKAFTQDEIRSAEQRGLLKESEARDLKQDVSHEEIIRKREQEIKEFREARKHSKEKDNVRSR